MTHTTTINTAAPTGVGFATANTWIDDNVEAEVDTRLRGCSAGPNRCGSDRHARCDSGPGRPTLRSEASPTRAAGSSRVNRP